MDVAQNLELGSVAALVAHHRHCSWRVRQCSSFKGFLTREGMRFLL